jgi:hypothetical protein
MPETPVYVTLFFICTCLAVVWLLMNVIRQSNMVSAQRCAVVVGAGISGWMLVQGVLAWTGVYANNTNVMPPRIFLLGILPGVLVLILLLTIPASRRAIVKLPLLQLTYLHAIRVPVELVLYGLCMHKAIPEIMTFEGRNFDILAGLTAPLVACWGIGKRKMAKAALLVWNFASLGLLINIIVHALLSAPSPFQQLAFHQPNVAILYFPFHWLPTVIVPIVLFAHIAAIKKLMPGSAAVQ